MRRPVLPPVAALAAIMICGPAIADIVHSDDVIIDGSLCVGFDCANGESFGFDTIRLKENNLRIHFDDTSNSASFPRNDWRIVANDTSNGGNSYLAFEDATAGRRVFEVRAGAPANSLFVSNGGNVGFGTSSPVVELHVKDGDTPTMRLEQDGSSGFTPQTWDVAGNETNFFVRDATNGSKLPFRIRPNAPSNSIFVDADGDVGLGTSAPDDKFHINRSGVVLAIVQSSDNNAVQMRFKSDSTNRRFLALDAANNVESQMIFGDGSVVIAGQTDTANRFATFDSTGVDINGAIKQRGGTVHADYVFEPDFELESIAEHANYMWQNKHLKGVGPGAYDQNGTPVLDVGANMKGMLEELEKAHIYIEQLHKRLETAEQENANLATRFDQLEASLAASDAPLQVSTAADALE